MERLLGQQQLRHRYRNMRKSGPAFAGPLRLSINPEIQKNGKEECARETQEGCPAPLKSTIFRTF